MDALIKSPIKFAHRGARSLAPDNTIKAFGLAIERQATGIESDAWVNRDGIVVLRHSERVGAGLRIGRLARTISDLSLTAIRQYQPDVASFAELLSLIVESRSSDADRVLAPMDLSIDVKDETVDAAFKIAQSWAAVDGARATTQLWLCLSSIDVATEVVEELSRVAAHSPIRVIHTTRLAKLPRGPERHAAQLDERDIAGTNFHCSDWTKGLTTLYHRFERVCFAWDCNVERTIVASLVSGCDAIYGDDVDLMNRCYEYVFR
jgi:glycerophosphoryl diester phosphodiesterase